MDVLSERTSFSSRDGQRTVSGSVMVVNFRRVRAQEGEGETPSQSPRSLISLHGGVSPPANQRVDSRDLFHSMAALYSSALPDMELEAIYATLVTKPTRSIFVLASEDAVLSYRKEHGSPQPMKAGRNIEKERGENGKMSTTAAAEEENEKATCNDDDYNDPYCSLFSDSEEEEGDGEGEGEVDDEENFEAERELFLVRVRQRQKLHYLDPLSIGVEDRLAGCATFMRLSSKPGDSSIQIILLAVRHRWRGCGIGEYLLRLCKDPAIVGHYDLILTYADHNAETFFSRHYFTDDPLVTTRHKNLSDYWENSTLMAYVAPYSASAAGSLKSLEAMEEQLKKWRSMSIVSHCEQVCIMERLRQEILLLNGRVSSQQEVIDTLHTELRDSILSRQILEKEFETYRTKMKEKLAFLMKERASEWLTNETDISSSNKNTAADLFTDSFSEHKSLEDKLT